jgi:hypothetical protein
MATDSVQHDCISVYNSSEISYSVPIRTRFSRQNKSHTFIRYDTDPIDNEILRWNIQAQRQKGWWGRSGKFLLVLASIVIPFYELYRTMIIFYCVTCLEVV